MKLNNLVYFFLLITFLGACKSENQESTTPTVTEDIQKEQVIDGIKATPLMGDEDNSSESPSGIPEYLDIELKGYGVPDANLNDFHGKVLFVNHWGSWCPPCRMEMPSIQSLYNDYGDKVEFVMIAMEKRQGAHVPYIQKEGYTFPVYTATSPIATEMKAKAFPTTIIVDKKGNIKVTDVGAKDWNAKEVRNLLDELLAEQ